MFFRGDGNNLCPTGRSSTHQADAVLAAKLIGLPEVATRVVRPLAIHQKAVLIASGSQAHHRLPHAAFKFFHCHRCLRPAGEVSRQQHRSGGWCREGKGGFLLRRFLFWHLKLSFLRGRSGSAQTGCLWLPRRSSAKSDKFQNQLPGSGRPRHKLPTSRPITLEMEQSFLKDGLRWPRSTPPT